MTLKELLKKITHRDYKVLYKDANIPEILQSSYREIKKEDIKYYLDYEVLALDENWNIIILGSKIVWKEILKNVYLYTGHVNVSANYT